MAAKKITLEGTKPKKGERMTGGAGWRLVTTKGSKRVFNGTLVETINVGPTRLAIFKVPK
jgi:hypothetical protein